MIRVTVELIPNGDEKRARVLAEGRIINVGGEGDEGDYRVILSHRDEPGRVWITGMVRKFDRRRGPWQLLFKAMGTTVGKQMRAEGKAGQQSAPGRMTPPR